MSLAYYCRKSWRLPLQTVVRRGIEILRRETARGVQRWRDRILPSTAPTRWPPGTGLRRYFPAPPPELLRPRADEIAALAELYLGHRFDLLGSGWTRVAYGSAGRGVEGFTYGEAAVVVDPRARINRANRRVAQRLRGLIEADYRPIDWHLDFKSGYRWSERTCYRRVPHGHLPGVDIKVPREISRMQHLALLVQAGVLARAGAPGFRPPEAYAREFRNQLLDFMAANPPRFGVNWACTMDVAIRAANWLVAFDLFRAAGWEFDRPFQDAFVGSLDDHARFIAANLEWGVEQRTNHYLADVTGLLFLAAFLPRSPRTDAWLAFAVRELVQESRSQFHPDGSSREGSTSYHRFAAEIVLYGTALVLGLPADKRAALQHYQPRLAPRPPGLAPAPLPLYPRPGGGDPTPFPAEHFQRLERMAEFSLHLMGPDGLVPQIGDNDSGRFLKLCPPLRKMTVAAARERYENLNGWDGWSAAADYWDEESGDHRHLVAACNGLFGRPDFAAATGNGSLETELVRGLAGGVGLPSGNARGKPEAEFVRRDAREEAASLDLEKACISEIRFPGGDLREGLELAAYPDFGLWIFRSRRLFLTIRCGPVGWLGEGGHSHNDQLSLVLLVDGKAVLSDPGTYLYTPLPARRNEYRSVRAHFAPQVADGREPGRLDLGLFRLGDETSARCLFFGEEGFLGRHLGFGAPVSRRVEILAAAVRISDRIEGDLRLLPAHERGAPPPFSPGYGKRLRR